MFNCLININKNALNPGFDHPLVVDPVGAYLIRDNSRYYSTPTGGWFERRNSTKLATMISNYPATRGWVLPCLTLFWLRSAAGYTDYSGR